MLSRKNVVSVLVSRIVFGGSSRLRDYERACFDWVRPCIGDDAWQTLDQQVHGLITLQRFSSDKLVLFGSLQRQTDIPLFVNSGKDTHFATVKFKAVGAAPIWRCDFTAANRRLSTIEFSRDPRGISRSEMEFLDSEAYADLMSDEAAEHADPPGLVHVLLDRLSGLGTLANVRPPADGRQAESFSSQTGSELPDDFLQLLRESNGFSLNGWQFYGTDGRRVVLPEATYTYLAESTDHAIAVRQGNDKPVLFIHNEIDDQFQEAGTSFLDAFVSEIRSGGNNEQR